MKAILFDFGGTIDTDGVHWSEKFWEYYQRFNIAIKKPSFDRAFLRSDEELLRDPSIPKMTFRETLVKQVGLQFKMLGISARTPEEIVDACYEDVQTTIAKARVVLDELHKKYQLGVVSNFYGNLEIVCEEFELDTVFDAKIDSVVVGVRKPDPAIFKLALDKLHVSSKEAFVVGDSYIRDIVPGKKLGCTTIWLKGKSWTTPSSTEAADFTIEKFEQIKKVIH
jgi:HAD superfamily hydrolase (TIGR01549 family)